MSFNFFNSFQNFSYCEPSYQNGLQNFVYPVLNNFNAFQNFGYNAPSLFSINPFEYLNNFNAYSNQSIWQPMINNFWGWSRNNLNNLNSFNNLNLFNDSPYNSQNPFNTNFYANLNNIVKPDFNNSNNINRNNEERPAEINRSKLFDQNTKLCIKKVKTGSAMPYLLIGPENVDPNEKLPVLVYLHGLYQKGSDPSLLESKGYDPAIIMKKWNLKNFRGYILCPQLPKNGSWCRKNTEKSVRNLLTEFQSTHNVDKSNISLIGFSLGGAGALYLANEMSDVFKKAVSLSPYEPGNLGSKMKIPTKAFAGGRDDSRPGGPIKMTNGKLRNILGAENCKIIPGKSHGELPPAVFCTDADNNGCSDVIEWLFA